MPHASLDSRGIFRADLGHPLPKHVARMCHRFGSSPRNMKEKQTPRLHSTRLPKAIELNPRPVHAPTKKGKKCFIYLSYTENPQRTNPPGGETYLLPKKNHARGVLQGREGIFVRKKKTPRGESLPGVLRQLCSPHMGTHSFPLSRSSPQRIK